MVRDSRFCRVPAEANGRIEGRQLLRLLRRRHYLPSDTPSQAEPTERSQRMRIQITQGQRNQWVIERYHERKGYKRSCWDVRLIAGHCTHGCHCLRARVMAPDVLGPVDVPLRMLRSWGRSWGRSRSMLWRNVWLSVRPGIGKSRTLSVDKGTRRARLRCASPRIWRSYFNNGIIPGVCLLPGPQSTSVANGIPNVLVTHFVSRDSLGDQNPRA